MIKMVINDDSEPFFKKIKIKGMPVFLFNRKSCVLNLKEQILSSGSLRLVMIV